MSFRIWLLAIMVLAIGNSSTHGQQNPLADVAPEPLAVPPGQPVAPNRGDRPRMTPRFPQGSAEQRINRINRMLGQLKREISKQKQDAQSSDQGSRGVTRGNASGAGGNMAPGTAMVNRLPSSAGQVLSPPKGSVDVRLPSPPGSPPREAEPATKQVTIEPVPMNTVRRSVALTSTVDSLSLANTLFAQGKMQDAKPIYEQLAKITPPSSDLTWIQYQLASCYRAEGRVADATRLYRIVVSSRTEAYWASRARWWLQYLEKAQRLEEKRKQLDETVAAARKELNDIRNLDE